MAKGSGKVLMALGVVLALISGGAVFWITSTATAAPPQILMKSVVVAKNEIAERTLLTDDLLDVVDLPETVIPPGAILGSDRDKLKDTFAKDKLYPRTPIQLPQVAAKKAGDAPQVQPTAAAAGAPPKPVPTFDVSAPYTILKGQTIVPVEYPEAAKLITAGVLRPGDRVDIYARTAGACGEQMALVFPNKEIKAIGTYTQTTGAAASSPTLIFVDTPQNALVLKFLETMNPFLLIRSVEDQDDPRRTDLVTKDYVAARFGLQRQAC